MHIIGTAGHVDHGKSSLVSALTGTNPDRWLEEQVRGMTLDLGFARLALPGGVEAGIVDVPGHERFLHNMLAGAAGMELLLLVVAANEGVMPQTREHLAMLRYLNVRQSIVVVSKIDLIEGKQRAAHVEAIRSELGGTLAERAELVPVSTLTGEGLDALRAAIAQELQTLPPRSTDAPAFLPVDRVFALAGHGTIVTGTLMQGRLRVGDRLQIAPRGEPVRVRSLQVFGTAREIVDAGSRVAVNLPGIDTTGAARGDVLADPQFAAADTYAVEFIPAAGATAMLRRRNPVRAYFGSAEILGTLVFETVPEADQPSPATLHLRRSVAVYPHEHFVIRRMSPKTLLGGGRVQTTQPQSAASDAPEGDVVTGVLAAAGAQPLTLGEIAARGNIREEVAAEMLTRLTESRRVVAISKPQAYLDAGAAQALLERIVAVLERRQREQPWIAGTTSLALARDLEIPETLLLRLLAAFADDGVIASRSGYFSTTDYTPHLTAEQRAFFDAHVAPDAAQPFVPVPLADLVAAVKSSKVPGIAQAFDTLLFRGALVKVGQDVYLGRQIADVQARVEAFLLREKQMTMAQFRDLAGSSRKYAVPLLEWFDARGITVRSGDFRMLRAKRAL